MLTNELLDQSDATKGEIKKKDLQTTVSGQNIVAAINFHFTISWASNGICLKWSTGKEENVERFDILHSRDGIHFSRLIHVAARGNSNFQSHYEWVHTTPAHGTNFYRIQQFDTDGQFSLSETKHLL